MRHHRIFAILGLALILLCQLGSLAQAKAPMRVVFIDPNPPTSVFWNKTSGAMQAAADDLGIQFRHFRTSPWPSETLKQVSTLLASPQRPDFLIAHISKNSGTSLINLAEQAKIPIFIINSGLERANHPALIRPRQQYKYWIGEMTPNDREAGKKLANFLIAQAHQKRKSPIKVIGLGGFLVDYAGYQRALGLDDALKQRSDAHLLQSVTADWSFSEAYRKTSLLCKRYPNPCVIWAADDRMALGAIKALRKRHQVPGKDILVGGINGEPGALRALSRGEMNVSLGGHFLEGAWAMVLLHDYFHGIDFAKNRVMWQTELVPITKNNLKRFQCRTDPRRINFRQFSKVYNHRLIDYHFNIQSLISGP